MKLACLLLGHTSYHLDSEHVAHCHRCRKPDVEWFEFQRQLQAIRDAGRPS